MRVPNSSPVMDNNRAPMGPEILSSTAAAVWGRTPLAFPGSNSALDKFQSAISLSSTVDPSSLAFGLPSFIPFVVFPADLYLFSCSPARPLQESLRPSPESLSGPSGHRVPKVSKTPKNSLVGDSGDCLETVSDTFWTPGAEGPRKLS